MSIKPNCPWCLGSGQTDAYVYVMPHEGQPFHRRIGRQLCGLCVGWGMSVEKRIQKAKL